MPSVVFPSLSPKKYETIPLQVFFPVCFGLKHPQNNPRHCMVSLFLCVRHHCHLTKRGITDICPFTPNPFQGQRAQKDPQAAAKLTHPTQPFTGQNQHIFFPGFSSSAPHAPWGPSVPATVLQSPSNPGPVHVPTPPSRCLGPKPSVWVFFLTSAGVEKSSQQHKASLLCCFSSLAGISGVSRSMSSITGTKPQVKPIPSPISHRGPGLSFC